MAKMGILPHYLYKQDTHEVVRNTVPYNSESDKRAANCDHLIYQSKRWGIKCWSMQIERDRRV